MKDKIENHKEQVKILGKIENELIKLISEADNKELMNKFLDWQDQRSKCNFELTQILFNLGENTHD